MRCLRFCAPWALALAVAGCGGGGQVTTAPGPREVKVQWFGNQSFAISSSIGTKILTNPFADGTGGRTLPTPLRPDIVLISHERPEANNVDAMEGQPTIFRGSVGTGVNNSAGISFRGVPTYRDASRESAEGMNVVYAWTMDGIRFCFLGALVQTLTPEQASQLGTVDVLFVPVGGGLSPADREAVLAQIRPRLVIPMGSGAGGWTTGRIHSVPGRSAMLSREILPLQTTTLLFGS